MEPGQYLVRSLPLFHVSSLSWLSTHYVHLRPATSYIQLQWFHPSASIGCGRIVFRTPFALDSRIGYAKGNLAELSVRHCRRWMANRYAGTSPPPSFRTSYPPLLGLDSSFHRARRPSTATEYQLGFSERDTCLRNRETQSTPYFRYDYGLATATWICTSPARTYLPGFRRCIPPNYRTCNSPNISWRSRSQISDLTLCGMLNGFLARPVTFKASSPLPQHPLRPPMNDCFELKGGSGMVIPRWIVRAGCISRRLP